MKDNSRLSNINISNEKVLISPNQLKQKIPLGSKERDFIKKSRSIIADIIHKRDHRLLVVCGPCSVHDVKIALDYAKRIKKLSAELSDQLYVVMRVYFEKPRTTIGWKGLINDPHLDGSFAVEDGLHLGRQLLVDLAELGVPVATEALDPISPQYLADTFSWVAIGARTTESQTHREMASGLSMPIGFKNGTDGNLDTAINAMQAASFVHHFMGINASGQVSVLTTQGNLNGHIILRGGNQTNYDSVSVCTCEQEMRANDLAESVMIDCSHANSRRDYRNQPLVAKNIIQQIREGNKSIIGVMLESNINEGSQPSNIPKEQMEYGVSITDACIGWEETTTLLRYMHQQLAKVLPQRINHFTKEPRLMRVVGNN